MTHDKILKSQKAKSKKVKTNRGANQLYSGSLMILRNNKKKKMILEIGNKMVSR